MKVIGTGFGHIVDLRRAIASLIHRIRKRVDRHFRNRIQPQDQVGREAAVEIGKRVFRFQPVNDVAV